MKEAKEKKESTEFNSCFFLQHIPLDKRGNREIFLNHFSSLVSCPLSCSFFIFSSSPSPERKTERMDFETPPSTPVALESNATSLDGTVSPVVPTPSNGDHVAKPLLPAPSSVKPMEPSKKKTKKNEGEEGEGAKWHRKKDRGGDSDNDDTDQKSKSDGDKNKTKSSTKPKQEDEGDKKKTKSSTKPKEDEEEKKTKASSSSKSSKPKEENDEEAADKRKSKSSKSKEDVASDDENKSSKKRKHKDSDDEDAADQKPKKKQSDGEETPKSGKKEAKKPDKKPKPESDTDESDKKDKPKSDKKSKPESDTDETEKPDKKDKPKSDKKSKPESDTDETEKPDKKDKPKSDKKKETKKRKADSDEEEAGSDDDKKKTTTKKDKKDKKKAGSDNDEEPEAKPKKKEEKKKSKRKDEDDDDDEREARTFEPQSVELEPRSSCMPENAALTSIAEEERSARFYDEPSCHTFTLHMRLNPALYVGWSQGHLYIANMIQTPAAAVRAVQNRAEITLMNIYFHVFVDGHSNPPKNMLLLSSKNFRASTSNKDKTRQKAQVWAKRILQVASGGASEISTYGRRRQRLEGVFSLEGVDVPEEVDQLDESYFKDLGQHYYIREFQALDIQRGNYKMLPDVLAKSIKAAHGCNPSPPMVTVGQFWWDATRFFDEDANCDPAFLAMLKRGEEALKRDQKDRKTTGAGRPRKAKGKAADKAEDEATDEDEGKKNKQKKAKRAKKDKKDEDEE